MPYSPTDMIREDTKLGRFRVNRKVYTAPEILELETERIFDRCWLYVGHESELRAPGDFRTRRLAGRPVIFVRGGDGKVRVLLNTCRHRGTMVCRERSGNASTFRCFYHAWTYDNTGRLIGVPGEQAYGETFRREDLGLMDAPRTDSYRGFFFVNFDPEAESLTDYLAGAKEYLDLFSDYGEAGLEIVQGSQEYSMRANWKLQIENSFDDYHPLVTHQRYLSGFLPSVGAVTHEAYNLKGKQDGGGHEVRELGNGHVCVLHPLSKGRIDPLGTTARSELQEKKKRIEASYGPEHARRVMDGIGNLVIFPDLVIIDGLHVIRTVSPVAPAYTETTSWAILPKEDDEILRQKHIANYLAFLGPGGFGTPDDLEAIEACQRGFAAREVEWSELSRGMKRDTPLITDEHALRAFHRRWLELMSRD